METLQNTPEMTQADRVDLARADIDRIIAEEDAVTSTSTTAVRGIGAGAISNESAAPTPDVVAQVPTPTTEYLAMPDYMQKVVQMGLLIVAHRTRNSQR